MFNNNASLSHSISFASVDVLQGSIVCLFNISISRCIRELFDYLALSLFLAITGSNIYHVHSFSLMFPFQLVWLINLAYQYVREPPSLHTNILVFHVE